MSENQEIAIEISYLRRYNLSNYNHKEYFVKLAGTEEQIQTQFAERKARVQTLLQQIEQMVDEAHTANIEKARLEKEATEAAVKEAEFKAQNATRIDGVK